MTEVEELEKVKSEIDAEFDRFEKASIRVRDKVYPGVTVEIGDVKLAVEEISKNMIYRKRGDVISTSRAVKK